MTTTWSQTSGGRISITFRPGLVIRLIGLGLIGLGVYKILWPIAQWVVSVLRPGSGGASIGDVVFLLVALVVGAAFVVPGVMLTFFGETARVEPVPRRVFTRHGFMGFGAEQATDVGDGAKVVVRMHVDQNKKSSTDTLKDHYHVTSWKVFVEQPGAERVEIGQFAMGKVDRARALAEAAAKSLALPVVDRAKAEERGVPESDLMTSQFLEKHGIDAPPRGFKVRAIGVVRGIVEALLS
jgi:hypothetical protein